MKPRVPYCSGGEAEGVWLPQVSERQYKSQMKGPLSPIQAFQPLGINCATNFHSTFLPISHSNICVILHKLQVRISGSFAQGPENSVLMVMSLIWGTEFNSRSVKAGSPVSPTEIEALQSFSVPGLYSLAGFGHSPGFPPTFDGEHNLSGTGSACSPQGESQRCLVHRLWLGCQDCFPKFITPWLALCPRWRMWVQ